MKHTHTENRRNECTNYMSISLLIFPEKVYARCLEKRYHEIFQPDLDATQYGFRPGRSTTDQIFTLQQIFDKSWVYVKDVCTCFVALEKGYD